MICNGCGYCLRSYVAEGAAWRQLDGEPCRDDALALGGAVVSDAREMWGRRG